MRFLVALAALLLCGCGASEPSPESVVRAWSQAVNSGDDDAAARLFAPGAQVVDGDSVRRLRTFEQALAWNTALRCARRVIALRGQGATVRASFVLGDRRNLRCDERGERSHALFRIEDGRIVLWHRLEPELVPEEEAV